MNLSLFKYLEAVCSGLKNPSDDKDLEAITQFYADGIAVVDAVNKIEWLVTDRVLVANKFIWDN